MWLAATTGNPVASVVALYCHFSTGESILRFTFVSMASGWKHIHVCIATHRQERIRGRGRERAHICETGRNSRLN